MLVQPRIPNVLRVLITDLGALMPIPMPAAVDDSVDQAMTKANAARNLPRYFTASALAGAYVGVAVVLLACTAGPLAASSSPATKLVAGSVFGVALTLVVFAGAELFTGNVMVMLGGLFAGRVRLRDVLVVNAGSLLGNFAGSVAFAAAVNASGVLNAGAKPDAPAPAASMVATLVQGKMAATGGQLFWRAVLCNMLVCLALWMAARTTSDAAKLGVLFWGLLAFVASGFEHSVANMTVFTLAILQGTAHWGDLGHNLLYTIPGNIVGGGLLVAAPYAWIGRRAVATPEVEPYPIDEAAPVVAIPEPSTAS
jgi:nitrite transporter NirC